MPNLFAIFSFIGKGFIFERALIKGLNLIVRINENQTHITTFFLNRGPSGSTENINFLLGHYYYRDINLYFVYDRQMNNGSHQESIFLMKQFVKKKLTGALF